MAPAIHVRSGQATRRILADALTMRGGGTVDAARAEVADSFVGLSAIDLAKECLRLDGISVDSRTNDSSLATRALSGGTLGDILATTFDATLTQAYGEMPDSTEGWVRESSAPNFKLQERWNLGVAPSLDVLPRAGTAKQLGIGADSENFRLHRFAKRFEITEEDLVADRLGAVMAVVRQLGRAARRVKIDLVYSLLLANADLADSVSLFDTATRGNLGTGALSAANLGTGVAAVENQVQDDQKGQAQTLNIGPAYLIVPPDLKVAAAGILNGLRLGQGDDLVLKSESRIGTNGVIDPITQTARAGTATNWCLFAPATEADVVEVAYLDGNPEPTISPYTLKAGQWGRGFAIRHDVGACVAGWRGSYKSTGAA